MPASRDGLGPLMTADGEVLLHGDFYLGNVLVHDDHVSALIDFEFSRMGPPDLIDAPLPLGSLENV